MTFRLQRPPTKTPKQQRQPPKQPAPAIAPAPAPLTLTLTQKLTHLSTPLHPLLNVTTGLPHPSFPRTLLHYHLLTHAQLDELASHYHQRTPGPWMFAYPYTEGREGGGGERGDGVQGGGGEGSSEGKALGWRRHGMGLESKRRKFGRFCGLRGCESPVLREASASARGAVRGEDGMGMGMEVEERDEEEEVMMVLDSVDADTDLGRDREVRERMEREWRSAVRRGREEEEWREKVGERRFW